MVNTVKIQTQTSLTPKVRVLFLVGCCSRKWESCIRTRLWEDAEMVVDERMLQWSLCPSFLEALLTSFISSLFMALACVLTSALGQDPYFSDYRNTGSYSSFPQSHSQLTFTTRMSVCSLPFTEGETQEKRPLQRCPASCLLEAPASWSLALESGS